MADFNRYKNVFICLYVCLMHMLHTQEYICTYIYAQENAFITFLYIDFCLYCLIEFCEVL